MKKSLLIFSFLAIALIPFASAMAQPGANEVAKLRAATDTMNEIMAVPEDGIPEALLRNAHGIAVFPNVLKAAFLLGGRYGNGVMIVRTPDGGWSPPSFVSIGGGSLGLQAGIESTDIILVFKSRRSVEKIVNGSKFTLGGEIAIAAGPVGRHASANTDAQLSAEIYSYSRNRGLFAGVALAGALLQVDNDSNADFYGRRNVDTHAIFLGTIENVPLPGNAFRCAAAAYTETPMRLCARL